jgi:type VI secretion system secreted protein Hcp
MAVDMFLKIDAIKGEAKDGQKKHDGEIGVLSWSWGMSQAGSTHHASGGGSGKVNVQDISITKYVDRASPNLIQNCCNGQHFKQAILTVRKAGGKDPVEYLVIKMEELLVSSVSTGGSGGGDLLTETITLNFAKFEFKYTEQTAGGGKGTDIPVTWNIQNNSPK